jgi:hypothetical protein
MWGERDPAKLDFVGLEYPKDGMNKNISSVFIFCNFPFFSGILFLSFWTVLFFSSSLALETFSPSLLLLLLLKLKARNPLPEIIL